MPLYRVFVYGTLKCGEPNSKFFMNNDNGTVKFIGKATTCLRYPLVIGSKFNIPFLLHKEGTGHHVKGEVYEVDHAVLKMLDGLEDHPYFYQRFEIQVNLDPYPWNESPEQKTTCWTYLFQDFKDFLETTQHFEEYSSTGTHGLVYIPSYLRSGEDEGALWKETKTISRLDVIKSN